MRYIKAVEKYEQNGGTVYIKVYEVRENSEINDGVLAGVYARALCIKKIALRRIIKNANSMAQ